MRPLRHVLKGIFTASSPPSQGPGEEGAGPWARDGRSLHFPGPRQKGASGSQDTERTRTPEEKLWPSAQGHTDGGLGGSRAMNSLLDPTPLPPPSIPVDTSHWPSPSGA